MTLSKRQANILCVDDDLLILELLQLHLDHQYQVHIASSAAQGLKLLKKHDDFSVIISDYEMPMMNGLDFLEQARHLSPLGVQILHTGNTELSLAIKVINESRIFRFLPKPASLALLSTHVAEACRQFYSPTETGGIQDCVCRQASP